MWAEAGIDMQACEIEASLGVLLPVLNIAC